MEVGENWQGEEAAVGSAADGPRISRGDPRSIRDSRAREYPGARWNIDPGAVTIHRLNREEYENSVNDLLGTDFELRDRLLPDDSAHGFDNIGDAQTLSPVQFVRYLDLAEWIVGQVVVDTGPPLEAAGVRRRRAQANGQRFS